MACSIHAAYIMHHDGAINVAHTQLADMVQVLEKMTGANRPLPGVTVVIPAYNYAEFLAEAIDSALAQDYAGPLEVLVVDDGSTDSTPQVANAFQGRIRYHRKQNAGLSAARNTGMEMAMHELVLFLDADDLLEAPAIDEMYAVWVGAVEKPVIVAARARMIDARGAWISEHAGLCDGRVEAFTARDFVLRSRFAPIVLAQRQTLLALGGFDPSLAASEDRDMWIRASIAGPVVQVHTVLHRKRDHGQNMSRHAERQTRCILRVLEKARSNPEIHLKSSDWREAEAICLYQSARIYLSAGERRMAIRQGLRSVRKAPWLTSAASVGYPPGFRARFLLLELWRLLKSGGASGSPAKVGAIGKGLAKSKN